MDETMRMYSILKAIVSGAFGEEIPYLGFIKRRKSNCESMKFGSFRH
jgi:hypothetical protein